MSDLMDLVGVEEEISNVLAVVEELPEGKLPIAYEYVEELVHKEMEAIDGIARAIRKRQAELEFLKSEESRLRTRRQSAEKRLSEFREFLTTVFQQHEIQQIKSKTTTAYLRKSESVFVEDVSLLPSEYVQSIIDFVPQKTLIKDALKSGQEVPGAKLNKRYTLVFN